MEKQFRYNLIALASMVAMFTIQLIPFSVHQAHGDRGGYYSPRANYSTTKHPYNLVKKVQKELSNNGYKVGNIDGIWGPKTSQAVKEFQEKEKLEVTGELDAITKQTLFLKN